MISKFDFESFCIRTQNERKKILQGRKKRHFEMTFCYAGKKRSNYFACSLHVSSIFGSMWIQFKVSKKTLNLAQFFEFSRFFLGIDFEHWLISFRFLSSVQRFPVERWLNSVWTPKKSWKIIWTYSHYPSKQQQRICKI